MNYHTLKERFFDAIEEQNNKKIIHYVQLLDVRGIPEWDKATKYYFRNYKVRLGSMKK